MSATLLLPISALAAKGGSGGGATGCNLADSDAEGLESSEHYYPGYWWDHTDLTIASKRTRAPRTSNSTP